MMLTYGTTYIHNDEDKIKRYYQPNSLELFIFFSYVATASLAKPINRGIDDT